MLIEEALVMALGAHIGQKRKGTELPYITHPLKVMNYLIEMKADRQLICAGILHDAVKPGRLTIKELYDNFGENIWNLVIVHDRTDLYSASWEIKMLVLADKLANSSDTLADYKQIGDEVWTKFEGGKERQKSMYIDCVKAISPLGHNRNTKNHYYRFKSIVEELFGEEIDIERFGIKYDD